MEGRPPRTAPCYRCPLMGRFTELSLAEARRLGAEFGVEIAEVEPLDLDALVREAAAPVRGPSRQPIRPSALSDAVAPV